MDTLNAARGDTNRTPSLAAEIGDVKLKFVDAFGSAGGRIHVIRAPGRVNLIGEHTDYNDGFVFPMAIEPQVLMACRTRPDQKVRLASTAYWGDIVQFALDRKIERGEPQWANYGKGVAAELLAAGIPVTGMDAMVANTLPIGGGLSSSAALEISTGLAFLTLAGLQLDPSRLALLCQKAEHEYANMPSGIMDQTIVASGRAGHAMLLDCRDLARHYVMLDSMELRIVVINSLVKHELSGGEYAKRRRECEEGVKFFQKADPHVKALRDVTIEQVNQAKDELPDVIFRRCRHVVSENKRTTDAAGQLAVRHYDEVGELMVQSHQSLRDDYEVSCPELDFLAAEALHVKGVYGARMTGGGFGGCIVALAQPRAVQTLIDHVSAQYQKRFGITPEAFVTTATAGAMSLE